MYCYNIVSRLGRCTLCDSVCMSVAACPGAVFLWSKGRWWNVGLPVCSHCYLAWFAYCCL